MNGPSPNLISRIGVCCHVVSVLRDSVEVVFVVIVVVVVQVVVHVGYNIEGQQNQGHEVETVEPVVASATQEFFIFLDLERFI